MTVSTKFKLTPKIRKMRVAIAKDVIAQLDADALTLGTGDYLCGDFDKPLKLSLDLSAVVDVVQKHCRVCALGACLLSKARLYDEVPLKPLAWDGLNDKYNRKTLSSDYEPVRDSLLGVFGVHQLDLIESAFEQSPMSDSSPECPTKQELYAAERFGRSHYEHPDRLRAIMQNIINHNGEFRPEAPRCQPRAPSANPSSPTTTPSPKAPFTPSPTSSGCGAWAKSGGVMPSGGSWTLCSGTRATQERGSAPVASKDFHLGDVLSIAGERLVSPEGIGGVYKILNHMTRDNLFTHQLPRAARECRPWLIRQHPQLDGIQMKAAFAELDTIVESENDQAKIEVALKDWLARQTTVFGETLAVEPIPKDDHDQIDPVEELQQMTNAEIIVVDASDITA